jgi:uncharacterized metal-binding protein YceD (DUF177 family)
MKFNPSDIGDEIVSMSGTLPGETLDLKEQGIRTDGEIAYRLTIQREEETLIVLGKLQTKLQLQCGRCLDWIPWPIEIDDFCVTFEPPLATSIDLTENVREDIILRLPLRAACELDAEHRCPRSGKSYPPKDAVETPMQGGDVWQSLDKLKIKE